MLKSQPQRPSKSTAEMFKVKIFRTRFIVALWGTFGPQLSPDIPLGELVKQFWFGEHFGTKYGRNSCRLGARSQQAVETGAGICGNVWVTAWKVSAGAQGDEGPGVLAAKAFQGHSGHSVAPSLSGLCTAVKFVQTVRESSIFRWRIGSPSIKSIFATRDTVDSK